MKKDNNGQKKQKTNNAKIVTKPKKHFNFSYGLKIALLVLLFLVALTICLIFATRTLEREKLAPIVYSEKGTIDYKVYLNKNEFYEKDYLEKNKIYIASLIKYIDIDYNYLFNIKKSTNMNFDYKIIGELVIENNSGTRRYFEKEYTILDTRTQKIDNKSSLSIKENVKIDYNYYNVLANSFRSTFGVDTNSYLNLYMQVNSLTDENLNYKIDNTNKINLKIPLSEKAIEINLNASDNEIIQQVVPTGKVVFNKKYLILEIITFIITSIIYVVIIKYLSVFFKKKSAYDKYVNKILKEYDRLIVETKSIIKMEKYNIIEVEKFTELLDVRDNLKVPIIYCNMVKHEKGVFYIKDNDDIYVLNVKNDDLE